jgi:hypothetical protein
MTHTHTHTQTNTTSTWQHTTFTRERDSHTPVWIRTHHPTKLAATELCLRLRGPRDRLIKFFGYETKDNICNTHSTVGNPTEPLATMVRPLIPSQATPTLPIKVSLGGNTYLKYLSLHVSLSTTRHGFGVLELLDVHFYAEINIPWRKMSISAH